MNMHEYLMAKKKAMEGSGLWYLLSGLQEADVVAAYQFMNRQSQAEALMPVCGGDYTLSLVSGGYTNPGVPTWSSDGVSIKGGLRGYSGLLNTSLNSGSSNHKSVFVRYKDQSTINQGSEGPFCLLYCSGSYSKMLMATGLGYNANPVTDDSVKAGPTLRYGSKAYYGSTKTYMKYQTGKPFLSSGVLGFVGETLYVNGVAVNCTTEEVYHISRMNIGGEPTNINFDDGLTVTFGNGIIVNHGYIDGYYSASSRSYTLEAAVIYNRELTTDQVVSVSTAMMQM